MWIFVGFSMKKYLGASARYFLFRTYRTLTGTVMFVFLRPMLRRNSRIASFVIPRSRRDCSDQVRGSFQPLNVPDLTSWAPFDLEIFTPSIAKWPL